MKLWIGEEREGKYKGIKTLFVGSPHIKSSEIINIINNNNKLKQIYFGAGGQTKINQCVVRECLQSEIGNLLITLEILSTDIHMISFDLLYKCNTIITIKHPQLLLLEKVNINNCQIKLEGLPMLCTTNLKNFDFVDTSDLRENKYSGDVILK